jgi:hypothetical protein
MTLIYSFSEAIKTLLTRKRTIAILIVLNVGLSSIPGLSDPSNKFVLVYFAGLLLSIYYEILIRYGLMRSIAEGDEEELSLGKYIEKGKKLFWRVVGLGLIVYAIIMLFVLIPSVFILYFKYKELHDPAMWGYTAASLSSIVFMRLYIFAPALLACRNESVSDAFRSVRKIRYGSAKHIFYLFTAFNVFNIFFRASVASKEFYYTYPFNIAISLAQIIIFIEAMRVIKAAGIDKRVAVYEAGNKSRLTLP